MADKDTPEKGYRPDLWQKGTDGKYEFIGSAQMAMKHPLLPPEIREFKTAKPIKNPNMDWESRKATLIKPEKPKPSKSGGGSGGVSDTRELQLGADLDPKALMKREDMKKGGKVKKMAFGGMPRPPIGGMRPGMAAPTPPAGFTPPTTLNNNAANAGVPAYGANSPPPGRGIGGLGMKKGGKAQTKSASSRGDGIAIKGKTKGRIV